MGCCVFEAVFGGGQGDCFAVFAGFEPGALGDLVVAVDVEFRLDCFEAGSAGDVFRLGGGGTGREWPVWFVVQRGRVRRFRHARVKRGRDG